MSTNITTLTRLLHLACRKLLLLHALCYPRPPRTTSTTIKIAHNFRNPNDIHDPSKLEDGRYPKCDSRSSNRLTALLSGKRTVAHMKERLLSTRLLMQRYISLLVAKSIDRPKLMLRFLPHLTSFAQSRNYAPSKCTNDITPIAIQSTILPPLL